MADKKKKIIIHNSSKAVKVLKAMDMPVLRLFPGYNYVDAEGYKNYFKNNDAAKGIKKECLREVDDVDADARKQAKASSEKNDALNKAQKIIKSQEKKLAEGDDTIKDLKKVNKEQADLLAELQKRLEKVEAKNK